MIRKTFKREIAIGLVAILAGLIAYAMSYVESFTDARDLIEILITPILAFAAAAYGMDWMGKQSPWSNNDLPPTDDYPTD